MKLDPSSGKGMVRLALACRRFQKKLAGTTGLSTNEILCLLILHTEVVKSVRELSAILDIPFTSSSKILSNIKDRGLIEITLHASDRRKERVVLTQFGKDMAEKMLDRSSCLALEVLESLPSNMKVEFTNWLQPYSTDEDK